MFDVKAFAGQKFKPREKELHYPDLERDGLGDGRFRVRGLTSEELAQADESGDRSELLSRLVVQLSGNSKDKVNAIMEGLGVSGKETPRALAKMICHFRMGMIEPEMQEYQVVKFAEVFPIEFRMIATEILNLTGKGQVALVKQPPSGETPESSPA